MADTWFSWSATDSSNTAVDGTNIATGMSPANVDNALRKVMAACRNSVASALQTFLAGTSALPVANGGTGAVTADAALTALGALADDYRDIPVFAASSSFSVADVHRGSGILWTGGVGTITIQPNSSIALNTGSIVIVYNNGSAAVTIGRGSGVTLKKNGGTTSADAVIAVGGQATLTKWATDTWAINGSGVS